MALTYTIVDGFSIVFLLIIFFSTHEKSSRLTDTRCFQMIVIMTIAALLCDMLAWRADGQAGQTANAVNWAANIICYILSGAMPLSWLYYTGLKMNSLWRINKSVWSLIAAPAIFLAIMAMFTPWTRLLFYIDAGNVYQRGSLFVIQMIIPFCYLFAAAFWAFMRARHERLRQSRGEYLNLSSFIIFPLLGGVLQLANYGISLAWPCSALSLLLVYVSMQNQKISLDALTGLNNRGQFDKHLYSCFERADGELPFALFMLDIDDFKHINDEYGHTAGDAALIDAANLLRQSLTDSNAFLARYGGDEFAIVLYYSEHEQIEELKTRINELSQARNQSLVKSEPYPLVFSIGAIVYDKKRYSNYQDMITAADALMYMQKREHKAARR